MSADEVVGSPVPARRSEADYAQVGQHDLDKKCCGHIVSTLWLHAAV